MEIMDLSTVSRNMDYLQHNFPVTEREIVHSVFKRREIVVHRLGWVMRYGLVRDVFHFQGVDTERAILQVAMILLEHGDHHKTR